MIVRLRVGDAKANHHLVQKLGGWQRKAQTIEIGACLEHQIVGSGAHGVALEERPVAAAIRVREEARNCGAMLSGRPQADRESRSRPAQRGIEHMRRQTAHNVPPAETRRRILKYRMSAICPLNRSRAKGCAAAKRSGNDAAGIPPEAT